MTREAKIGLLTGLGVIVLIGVLLSEYLGGPANTNRMAALPLGASYRDQVMQPVGVPGTVRTESAAFPDAAAAAQFPAPAAPNMAPPSPLPRAWAQGDPTDPTAHIPSSTDPVMGQPVTPIPDGRMSLQPLGDPADNLAILQLLDRQAASSPPGGNAVAPKPVISGEVYVIASGDTLAKIARKFYKSAKIEDEQRIVAANPSALKNVGTMLIAGKKLLIPSLPRAVVAAGKPPAKADAAKTDSRQVVVIHPPGSGVSPENKTADAARFLPQPEAAKAQVNRWYTVQDGDTLDKIARKLSATNYQELAKKIATLNKIKDPHGLQVGTKLKLPVKA